jgi:two-component system sensor histidine kinase TctE
VPLAPARRAAQRWRERLNQTGPRQEQRSLFGEILDWMFAPMVLLWPLSVLLILPLARTLADAPFDRALYERTEVLIRQVQQAPFRSNFTQPRSTAPQLLPGSSDEADKELVIQVIAPSGQLLAGASDLPSPGLYDFPEPGRIKLRTVIYRGSDMRVGYAFVDDGRSEDGATSLVQVAEPLDDRNRLTNEIIKGVIFPQLLILPISVLLVWFGLWRGLAPIRALQQRLRARASDDLSPVDQRGTPEDIAPLIDAFNELLERMHQNLASQRRFIASAAHQMKTPLAGMRTQSELALRETDPGELQDRLQQIAVGSQRATHLISQLLALARTESPQQLGPRTPLDLSSLARETLEPWISVALERSIDLGFDAHQGPALIAGHEVLLRELINNLIDNALRYCPSGAAVTVRVRPDLNQIHLDVEDNGPGIPASEREHIFERFYRVLGSGVDGSGLGLAIVKEIAQQHDAQLTVQDAHPERLDGAPPGVRFTVSFRAF